MNYQGDHFGIWEDAGADADADVGGNAGGDAIT